MADRNGNNGGPLGKLADSLENRAVMLFVATILGISGNQILTQVKPETVRPDPFTGTDGKRLQAEIHEVERLLNAHLIRGEAGFQRIRELERRVRELEQSDN